MSTKLLILVLIGIVSISGFFYFRNQSSNDKQGTLSQSEDKLVPPKAPQFKTYTNTKFGFSIQYPQTLEVREYPDTNDGAGFRPAGTSEDPVNEVIEIRVLEKNADMANDPPEDYAKVAATIQIQNYQKLNSIEPVTTNSGLTGYKTTWMVTPTAVLGATESGQPTVSLPITYFDLPKAQTPSTVQVTLGDKNYDSDYEAMIKTFSE